MNQKAISVVGCTLLAVGLVLAVGLAFFENAITAAGIPYHFLGYSAVAALACAGAAACGVSARATPAGKVALVGGVAVGVVYVEFVVLVLTAFSRGG